MINVYKSPISKEKYANLFLDKIPESAKNVCLLFIGHSETVHYIMSQKPEIDFTVIDGSDVTEALPYIYTADNLKERITFEESDCEDETFLKKLETCFENYIMNNMSFDLIIANPPFGKQCSLAKPIIKKALEACNELVVLSPRNVLLDNEILKHTADYKSVEGQQFTDAITWSLHTIKLLNTQSSARYTIEDICFTDKQKQLYKAVTAYNKSHISHIVLVDGSYIEPKWEKPLDACTKLPKSDIFKDKLSKKLKDLVKDQEVFVKTLFAGIDGVHFNDCHDFKYNLRNEYDMKWNKGGHPIDFFVFVNKQERDNFSDWWYSCNKLRTSKKERIGLTNAFLDLIVAAGRGGVGYFGEYFPKLDWSKPHTDAEILKEIGLPEDVLEQE